MVPKEPGNENSGCCHPLFPRHSICNLVLVPGSRSDRAPSLLLSKQPTSSEKWVEPIIVPLAAKAQEGARFSPAEQQKPNDCADIRQRAYAASLVSGRFGEYNSHGSEVFEQLDGR